MNITLLAWCGLFLLLVALTFRRPVWGIPLYFLTFFASPTYWWWGAALRDARVALVASLVLLASTVFSPTGFRFEEGDDRRARLTVFLGLLILANATLVHYLLSPDQQVSSVKYELMVKYTLFFVLMVAAVRTRDDLRIVVLTLAGGLAYYGYEIVLNGRGSGRLDTIGSPGAQGNALAAVIAALVPFAGWLLVSGRGLERVLGAFSAATTMEILGRCNTRGAFLGLLGAACVLVVLARRKVRRKVMIGLALGLLGAAIVVARDERVLDRFVTTFAGADERDGSAKLRLLLWRCGMDMVKDYPFGSGGNAFKYSSVGQQYKSGRVQSEDHSSIVIRHERLAVHNGYINEAIQWGVQGFALKLLLVVSAMLAVYRTLKLQGSYGDQNGAFLGVCTLAAFTAFLIKSLTGDSLDYEMVYWLAGMGVLYSRVYGPRSMQDRTVAVASVHPVAGIGYLSQGGTFAANRG
jgi:O-antigen ligase